MENNKPTHIAFIMDGNGRWATKNGFLRKLGHKKGVETLKRLIDALEAESIKYATFYAFSTENWKRPQDEINYIFSLIKTFIEQDLSKYIENKRNIKVTFIGDINPLPADIQSGILDITTKTEKNDGINVIIAVNYGARDEIIYAVNKLIESGKGKITESDLKNELYTKNIPDPDIIVRSAGEKRLSNFLLFQAAYSEFIFVDDLWPDFNKKTLEFILNEYGKRKRKFGGLNENK